MGIFNKDPLQIIVFKGYGTNSHFYVRGRALEDENINLHKSGFFKLFANSWKRFGTDEIRNTELKITLNNTFQIYTKTDSKGYFSVNQFIDHKILVKNRNGWLHFQVSYAQPHRNKKINLNNIFPGQLMIPSKNAEFGIISDIDDTILHTGVVSKLKWKLLINTFFISPAKRKALEGASTFYQLLHAGLSGKNKNPFFYVSHSPWNMYLYLEYFLNKNKFPKGAILLRAMHSILGKKSKEKPQKQKEIVHILKTYPGLSFILIGDAGELDADIYLEIVRSYPHKIKAIYLRSVQNKKRMRRIRNLVKGYTTIPFLIVNSSKEAIEHAKEHRFIKDL